MLKTRILQSQQCKNPNPNPNACNIQRSVAKCIPNATIYNQTPLVKNSSCYTLKLNCWLFVECMSNDNRLPKFLPIISVYFHCLLLYIVRLLNDLSRHSSHYSSPYYDHDQLSIDLPNVRQTCNINALLLNFIFNAYKLIVYDD